MNNECKNEEGGGMNKRKLFRCGTVVVALFFLVSKFLLATEQKNLIPDGDFQTAEKWKAVAVTGQPDKAETEGKIPEGWRSGHFYRGEGELEIVADPLDSAGKNRVVKMLGNKDGGYNAGQFYTHYAPIEKSKEYLLSLRYLSRGQAKGSVWLKWLDANDNQVLTSTLFYLKPSPDNWTKFQAKITAPAEKAEKVCLGLSIGTTKNGAGFYFDDIQLIPLLEPQDSKVTLSPQQLNPPKIPSANSLDRRVNLAPRQLNPDMATSYREGNSSRWKVCLNGLWSLAPANVKEGQKQEVTIWTGNIAYIDSIPVIPEKFDYYIKVPGRYDGRETYLRDSRLKPLPKFSFEKSPEFKTVWYERELVIPFSWKEKKLVLVFDGVNVNALVFLNKKYAGAVREPLRRKRIEITPLAKYGEKNQLALYLKGKEYVMNMGPGLIDDVWLEVLPKDIRLEGVQVVSDSAAKQIKARLRLTSESKKTKAVLIKSAILKDKEPVAVLPGKTTALSEGENKIELVSPAQGLKPWSFEDPQLYYLKIELCDEKGNLLDELTARFGCRTFEVKGADFYLNGKKTHLRWCGTMPFDNYVACRMNEEYIRNTLLDLKALGYNGIRSHPCNTWPERVFTICDEVGMLASAALPGLAQGDQQAGYTYSGLNYKKIFEPAWQKGYRSEVGPVIEDLLNHPSLVLWTTSSCLIWSGAYPTAITGKIYQDLGSGSADFENKMKAAEIQEKIIKEFDATRPIVLCAMGGNLGQFVSFNYYPMLTRPMQENEESPSEWAKYRAKPLLQEEYCSSPDGVCAFNDVTRNDIYKKGGWTTLYLEYGAKIFGDQAYYYKKLPVSNDYGVGKGSIFSTSYETTEKIPGHFTLHWYLPLKDGETFWWPEMNETFMKFNCLYTRNIHRAWRTYAISGLFLFDSNTPLVCGALPYRAGFTRTFPKYDDLTTPGFKPDYWELLVRGEKTPYYYTLKEVWAPLLVYIGGGKDNFTSKDHGYFSREEIRKQIIAINDRLEDVSIRIDWKVTAQESDKAIASGKEEILLHPGDVIKKEIPFKAPKVGEKKGYLISLKAYEGEKEINSDTFAIQVFPREKDLRLPKGQIVLYDEKGLTKEMLSKAKVDFVDLNQIDDLSKYRLLIIGRESFTLDLTRRLAQLKAAQAFSEGRLNILSFEQKPLGNEKGVIDKYLGDERSARNVFIRDWFSPVLAGLDNEDFSYWRGSSDLTTAYPSFAEATRGRKENAGDGLWHKWGNTGVVSSFPIRKFNVGKFKPILDCEYDQLRSPLMELQEGKGKLILCQLDVTSRYGIDPVATRVVNNLLNYSLTPSPPEAKTAYLGGEKGREALKRLFVKIDTEGLTNLGETKLLIVGEGGEKELLANKKSITGFVQNGGTVFCLPEPADADLSWLPFPLKIEEKEFFRVFVDKYIAKEPLLSGLGNSEFYFRNNYKIPVVTAVPEGGFVTDPGLVARIPYGKGAYIFCQADPATFQKSRAEEKVQRLLLTLLNNCGANTLYPLSFLKDIPPAFNLEKKWLFAIDPENKGEAEGWHKPLYDDASWRQIKVPGAWEEQGVTNKNQFYTEYKKGLYGPGDYRYAPYDGYAWYRQHLIIPSSAKGIPYHLKIGCVDDTDVTWFNGEIIGKTGEDVPAYWQAERHYAVPEKLINYGGDNVIAIRVFDKHSAGGILKGPAVIYTPFETLCPLVKEFRDFNPNYWKQW